MEREKTELIRKKEFQLQSEVGLCSNSWDGGWGAKKKNLGRYREKQEIVGKGDGGIILGMTPFFW